MSNSQTATSILNHVNDNAPVKRGSYKKTGKYAKKVGKVRWQQTAEGKAKLRRIAKARWRKIRRNQDKGVS